jgi:ATP-dependent Lon protease
MTTRTRRPRARSKAAKTVTVPLLVRRDTIVFPNQAAQILVFRNSAQRAVEAAMEGDRRIAVVGRRNFRERDFTAEDLYGLGVMATVSRTLKMPDGSLNILLEGTSRVTINRAILDGPVAQAEVTILEEVAEKTDEVSALMRAVLALFEEATKLSPQLGEDAHVMAMNVDDPGWLADLVTSYLQLSLGERQEILEVLSPLERLRRVSRLLAKELEILQLQKGIQAEVQEEVEKSQREHLLREQMRVVRRQLGEVDPQSKDTADLREKIQGLGMPEEVQKKALEEIDRLEGIPSMSPEVGVVRNYLDWLVSLPWQEATEDNLDTRLAAEVLNQNHYGLKRVKERILEYMAVRKLSQGKLNSPILCFVGAPGVGKTSLGKSIATALGRKFVRVSLGGTRDEAEIRGHRRTYVGAMPGRIIQTMRTAGTVNPVFMLDELDKLGSDFRGDPSSALLEVLDPEQNHAFSDHYLEVPYDLSKVLFIATANVLDPVLPALRDRLEVIELPGYTEEEKIHIARRFLIPKQLEQNGLGGKDVRIAPAAVRRIVREYTREAGVRNLEREIGGVYRKIAKVVAEDRPAPRRVGASALPKYLGPTRFTWGTAGEKDEIGVATGVARTEAGGDVLSVEVTLMKGKGNLTLTGSLGDVMKESAQAALSYARSHQRESLIKGIAFDEQDIHVHVPAGAVPKDGPSAGVTMAAALVSALSGRPVRKNVAMTGEITLRGKVLEVGGIKEKALAAHRAGITTFLLPKKNMSDLADLPAKVRRDIQFLPMEWVGEVLGEALVSSGGAGA